RRDDDGLHRRELAFLVAGEVVEEMFADHVAEDRVSQELEALVAGEVLVLRRRVGHRLDGQTGILESMLQLGLEVGEDFFFAGSRRVHAVPVVLVSRPAVRRRGLPMIPGIHLIRGIKSKASAAPEAPLSYHKGRVLATTLGPRQNLGKA